jgi:hypothetical protein
VEPRADKVLRDMSAYLADHGQFVSYGLELYDEIDESGQLIQYANHLSLAIRKPDRLAMDVRGDTANRSAWYDGKTLSLLDKRHNAYGVIEVPSKLNALLDFIVDEYGVSVPWCDFLYDDVYEVLMENTISGRYVGLHDVAGAPCHHLAFRQDNIDWQLWVEAGDIPMPRKLVITYTGEPGRPQYSMTVLKWAYAPNLKDSLFRFQVPSGAEKMDLSSIGTYRPAR